MSYPTILCSKRQEVTKLEIFLFCGNFKKQQFLTRPEIQNKNRRSSHADLLRPFSIPGIFHIQELLHLSDNPMEFREILVTAFCQRLNAKVSILRAL